MSRPGRARVGEKARWQMRSGHENLGKHFKNQRSCKKVASPTHMMWPLSLLKSNVFDRQAEKAMRPRSRVLYLCGSLTSSKLYSVPYFWLAIQ